MSNRLIKRVLKIKLINEIRLKTQKVSKFKMKITSIKIIRSLRLKIFFKGLIKGVLDLKIIIGSLVTSIRINYQYHYKNLQLYRL